MDLRELIKKWELISYQSKDHFKSTTLLQHHAIQFIAMAGRYLSSPRHNEKNLSMEWYLNKKMLIGSWIDAKKFPFKIGIRTQDLYLVILDPSFSEITGINLQGKTKAEVFDWLNKKMHEFKVELGNIKMELYYQLPAHETDDGRPFEIKDKQEMIELSKIMTNTFLMLQYFTHLFDDSIAISVWPEDFNFRFTIPVEYNNSGKMSKYVHVGLAVPDSFYDHHYFYVSHRDESGSSDYEKIRELDGDGQWVTKNNPIAILPLNMFFSDKSKEDQVQRLYNFYSSALNNTFDILVSPELKISH
jgi:hypothetical protein